ncbi:MAG TPA: HPr family phosphocarrier protein [Myxococcota bacterium]|nr:HPr family phosphocarrier protein [Myxococcota bacterium]
MSAAQVHESEFVVQGELGLHARPASQFVALAARFRSAIHVGRGDEWVDGRSILSLLSLAASRGTALRIRAEGDDAAEAVEALGRLIEQAGHPAGKPAAN